jgi:hypothetical protein
MEQLFSPNEEHFPRNVRQKWPPFLIVRKIVRVALNLAGAYA